MSKSQQKRESQPTNSPGTDVLNPMKSLLATPPRVAKIPTFWNKKKQNWPQSITNLLPRCTCMRHSPWFSVHSRTTAVRSPCNTSNRTVLCVGGSMYTKYHESLVEQLSTGRENRRCPPNQQRLRHRIDRDRLWTTYIFSCSIYMQIRGYVTTNT